MHEPQTVVFWAFQHYVYKTAHLQKQIIKGILKKQNSEFHLHFQANLEGDFSCESVSVVNNRHAVISIPTVQLDASTALEQHLRHNP